MLGHARPEVLVVFFFESVVEVLLLDHFLVYLGVRKKQEISCACTVRLGHLDE